MGTPPQIDTFAQVTFDERLRFQAQQMTTKLRGTVMEEELDGEKRFFDQYGAASMVERLTRGQANTPQEIARARRAITPRDFEYTEEFDLQKDVVRVRNAIVNDSQFERAILMAVARKIDDLIIEASHGDALTGKNGTTVQGFDTANQNITGGGTLTAAIVREGRKKLKAADVDTADLYIDVHPDEIDDMLGDTNVTSIDTNTVRALVEGEFTRYLGFTWMQTTRIITGEHGATGRWATMRSRDAVIFGVHGGSISTEWEKLPGRGKTWQYAVYGTMAATRQFENKIARADIT